MNRSVALIALYILMITTNASAQWIACTGGSQTCTTQSVGIGTTSPVTNLDVNGQANVKSGATGGFLVGGAGVFFIDNNGLINIGNGSVGNGISFFPGSTQPLAILKSGMVGIGTTQPGFQLTSRTATNLTGSVTAQLSVEDTSAVAASVGGAILFRGVFTGSTLTEFAAIQGGKDTATAGEYGGQIRFFTRLNGGGAVGNYERMRIDGSGNVGIGTTTPAARLDVNGNINVSGNIAAKYQDVAEWVPATNPLDAGTVVVLNPEKPNEVMASAHAYDTAVAGVVSSQPGVILGESSKSKEKVATTGRVMVRVDASRSPIRVGDLLVTSDEPGTAMRSEPIDVGGTKIHRPGTIIGKALQPLPSGQGEILILLALQ